MNIRFWVITSVLFIVTGCITNFPVSDRSRQARRHMELAAAKETSFNFQEAIKEYNAISRNYPDTPYYKPAIFKAALLNLHPDNPDIDYAAAQDRLHIYLNLPLSSEEEEIATVLDAIILQSRSTLEERNQVLTKIKQQNREMALLTEKLNQSQKDAAAANEIRKKLSQYEAELSILKSKSRKMKEIDIQLHKTRKTGNDQSLETD
jgi:hypothetical protein